jgi:putative endonuclease
LRKWVFQDGGIYLRIYNLRYTAYNVIPAKAGIQNSMPKLPVVYILASKRNGTLYIGVTNDLQRRAWDHKNDLLEGFTKRYGVHRLVYYELHGDMVSAISREKQMKKWNRAWKLEAIERQNPEWKDLWEEII